MKRMSLWHHMVCSQLPRRLACFAGCISPLIGSCKSGVRFPVIPFDRIVLPKANHNKVVGKRILAYIGSRISVQDVMLRSVCVFRSLSSPFVATSAGKRVLPMGLVGLRINKHCGFNGPIPASRSLPSNQAPPERKFLRYHLADGNLFLHRPES